MVVDLLLSLTPLHRELLEVRGQTSDRFPNSNHHTHFLGAAPPPFYREFLPAWPLLGSSPGDWCQKSGATSPRSAGLATLTDGVCFSYPSQLLSGDYKLPKEGFLDWQRSRGEFVPTNVPIWSEVSLGPPSGDLSAWDSYRLLGAPNENHYNRDTWLALSVERVALHLGVVSLSPPLGAEIAFKKQNKILKQNIIGCLGWLCR